MAKQAVLQWLDWLRHQARPSDLVHYNGTNIDPSVVHLDEAASTHVHGLWQEGNVLA